MKIQHAKDFVLSRLRQGYYTFSIKEAEDAIGVGEKAWEALDRLVKQGWLFSPSPSKGFYVIIDPQHQGRGYLPVEWFIDDWMRYLGGQYYIGLLTAAKIHGASHQQPQQIQIIRDKTLLDVVKGPYHISFFFKKTIHEDCYERRESPAGYYRVSTPEMTAYDLLRYRKACPSLDLAASVIQELGESITSDRLAALVEMKTETAVLQRLGWLLDFTGWVGKTDLLADAIRSKQVKRRLLRTDLPDTGLLNPRWQVVVNANVETDQ